MPDLGHDHDDLSQSRRAAVLFGPEDFGLSNEALERCNAIVTIPTVPADASLNLGQAAVVVAYELYLAARDAPRSAGLFSHSTMPPDPDHAAGLATGAELDALCSAATRMYGALHPASIEGQTRAAVARLRALILRAVPRSDEVAQLRAIFEHVSRAVDRRPALDGDSAQR